MFKRSSILILIVFFSASTFANAQNDKIEFCPNEKQIHITITDTNPSHYRYILWARNMDEKYFVSPEIEYSFANRPASPIFGAKESYYIPAEKKLVCIYSMYHVYEHSPKLINYAGY